MNNKSTSLISMHFVKYFRELLYLAVLNLSLATLTFADDISKIDQKKTHGDYVRKRFLPLMKKPFNLTDQSKTKILIIGDSHAQDFLNAIAENSLLTNSQIQTRYIPTRCQIFLGDKSNRKWINEDIQLCEKSDNLTLAKAQIAEADVVILAALWRKWATLHLPQTLKHLNISPQQELYVIGRRSFLSISKDKIHGLSDYQLLSMRNEVDIDQIEINDLMSETLDKNIFIDVHKLFCGTGVESGSTKSCPVFTDRLKQISLDGGHLSQDGARYLGGILFKESQLSNLIK